ncbi:MAG: ferritin [Spirochaetia bacterium]
MLESEITKALNGQIKMEFFSSYIYLAMAAYFENTNLTGFGHWMHLQSREETEHGMRIFRYIIERGGAVDLQGLDTPPKSYKSPLDVFEAALAHERKVTASINALVELAQSKKDHATEVFLQWFVKEQVEEEANADAIVQMLRLADNTPGALFMLDKELGRRGSE